MLSAKALAERDGPRCWICANEVDPRAPRGSSWAGSADHLIPRAAGGDDSDANLALAHRSCNSERGSRLEELEWPREIPVLEHTRIWPAMRSCGKRPGSSQIVGVLAGAELAQEAQTWLSAAVEELLGPGWIVSVAELTSQHTAVRLELALAGAARTRRKR